MVGKLPFEKGVSVKFLHPCALNKGARKGPHPTTHHPRPYHERISLTPS